MGCESRFLSKYENDKRMNLTTNPKHVVGLSKFYGYIIEIVSEPGLIEANSKHKKKRKIWHGRFHQIYVLNEL